jgi:acetaldehyde dehydrogenase/alcohol dehydrogenase
MWPKYEHFRADEDYATLARYIGLQGSTNEELKEALIAKIVELAHSVDVNLSLKGNGVDKKQFDGKVDQLSELAFADQFSFANPKEPLIAELKDILVDEYTGKNIEK